MPGRPTSLSLDTKLAEEGNQRLLSVGVDYGLKMYDSHLDGVVANVALGHRVPLQGTFVAIEILGHVGRRAGLDGRLLTVKEARGTLEQHLEEWTEKLTDAEKRGELKGWRDVVPAPSALQCMRLLSLLDPEAKIYFADCFEAPGGSSEITQGAPWLKATWGLGWYLAARTSYGG